MSHWSVAFEYYPESGYVPWECWDEKTFRVRSEAIAFAKNKKNRKLMKGKRLRKIHYKREA